MCSSNSMMSCDFDKLNFSAVYTYLLSLSEKETKCKEPSPIIYIYICSHHIHRVPYYSISITKYVFCSNCEYYCASGIVTICTTHIYTLYYSNCGEHRDWLQQPVFDN